MAAQATASNDTSGPGAPAPSFDNFAHWMQSLQARDAVTDSALASPQLAQAWADALLRYWQAGVDAGRIDIARPFYVVDLAPGQGRFAWLLLRALRAKMNPGQRAWPLCLLACCDDAAAGAALLAHPYLADWVAAGQLDAATFDLSHGNCLSLLHAGVSLLQADNPLVLLGLEFFHTLPSELFAVHYGQLLEGRVAPEAGCPPAQAPSGASHALRYQWQAASSCGHGAAALLDYYRARFHSTSFLLPSLALDVLRRLQHIAGGRYLLLAADAGHDDETMLRLGGLGPPAQRHAQGAPLPVNFHALTLRQRWQGATVCNLAGGDDGVLVHLACRDPGGFLDEQDVERLCADLEAAHPGHGRALREQVCAGDGASSGAMLALLRQCGYDPVVFKALAATFLRQPPALDEGARRAWLKALAACWANFMPAPSCDDFHTDCARFAMQLGSWGAARDCLQTGLAFYGDEAHDLYLLAWCEEAAGDSMRALACVQSAVALDPAHAGAQALLAQLDAKLDQWRRCAWYEPACARQGELRLEPLGAEHAPALLYQYRDEQIGIMTRLPPLASLDEVQAWIAGQAGEAGRVEFAVMHASWGLVGVVSCQCAGSAGYFCYWIGCDFQQRGYGQGAARLLFRQLEAIGVTDIYSSVDKANGHSQYLMHKLGFAPVDIDLPPQDDDQYFYYRGDKRDAQDVRAGLSALSLAIDCPVQAASACKGGNMSD